jgi:rhodanese-related sulfurtransferase
MGLDQVRPADLDAWLASQGGEGIVLDVREAPELRAASVQPGPFKLLSIPMMDVPSQIGQLDPDTPVACLCHHGARSMRVAMFLAQNGFTRVANIAGGIDAWSQERDPAVPRY